ncbi:hypothetical protein HELRODRAFT_177348 [Helobdella robusta]|uniref:C-type lectin domain-containing protein n=1 Tax=Helobdella robusta TaxID=6412 RepID=T1FBJ5_HELRO|nr:hypothetical protein HELRODRAFT_177348 [Helobdella robusta]ESN98110.1 hypothetical protein HELRODRAFT_177348 [Helobdella robusta]
MFFKTFNSGSVTTHFVILSLSFAINVNKATSGNVTWPTDSIPQRYEETRISDSPNNTTYPPSDVEWSKPVIQRCLRTACFFSYGSSRLTSKLEEARQACSLMKPGSSLLQLSDSFLNTDYRAFHKAELLAGRSILNADWTEQNGYIWATTRTIIPGIPKAKSNCPLYATDQGIGQTSSCASPSYIVRDEKIVIKKTNNDENEMDNNSRINDSNNETNRRTSNYIKTCVQATSSSNNNNKTHAYKQTNKHTSYHKTNQVGTVYVKPAPQTDNLHMHFSGTSLKNNKYITNHPFYGEQSYSVKR